MRFYDLWNWLTCYFNQTVGKKIKTGMKNKHIPQHQYIGIGLAYTAEI